MEPCGTCFVYVLQTGSGFKWASFFCSENTYDMGDAGMWLKKSDTRFMSKKTGVEEASLFIRIVCADELSSIYNSLDNICF